MITKCKSTDRTVMGLFRDRERERGGGTWYVFYIAQILIIGIQLCHALNHASLRTVNHRV